MATNLLFGHNALLLGSSYTIGQATNYPAENLLAGPRGEHWRSNTSATSHTLTYDTGTSATTVTYTAIARADLLAYADTAQTTAFLVKYSTDNVSFSNWHTTGSIWTGQLLGPNLQDYVYYTSTPSTNARYWRFQFTTTDSITPQFSKFFLGLAFDIGRDPESITLRRMRPGQAFRKPYYEIRLTYRQVTYAKTIDLLTYFGEVSNVKPLFIFTDSYHEVLNSHRVIHCIMSDLQTPKRIDSFNDVSMVLEEVI